VTTDGYYRFPTLHGDTVVFVCEDDLWAAPVGGGVARRLTANLGPTAYPVLSPDGRQLAFVGREDGETEVYVMPAEGGPATRLTFLGAATSVVGWMPNGEEIIFASNAGQPFRQITPLYAISPAGGQPRRLPYGPARSISFGPTGGVVIGRKAVEMAYWKRYRGGTAGDIWLDAAGNGRFKPLLKLKSNIIRPIWLGERIYFLSDHQGVGNLYSCTLRGTGLKRHTNHADYYVRHPTTDGRRIVYSAGADLYMFDPAANTSQKIEIQLHSPRVQRNRRFVNAAHFLESYALHPAGHSLALTVRGKAFGLTNWEGAVLQYGQPHGVRYRLAEWLNDGKRLVMLSDAAGEEAFEIYPDASQPAPEGEIERLDGLDIGRPLSLSVSPTDDLVAFGNHRYELVVVDLKNKTAKMLDSSKYGRIAGLDWSPDGKWLAYGLATSLHTCAIKLRHLESGETHFVTPPNNLLDFGPSFDPEGKYLYFISYRDFDPVHDSVYFDLNFPRGSRPYLVTLQQDLPNPFGPQPAAPAAKSNGTDKPAEKTDKPDGEDESGGEKPAEPAAAPPAKTIQIDLPGIQGRIVALPVPEGKYRQVRGVKGKLFFTLFPVEGSLKDDDDDDGGGKGALELYDFAERKKEFVVNGVNSIEVSRQRQYVAYRSGKNLRVFKATDKLDNNATGFTKKSGWIKLNRLRVAVSPPEEWQQMFREAWRLQRDHFWAANMSSVDWELVFKRYYPLIDRVASRAEFSDLLWEMQGELGTSHAYELGGDYRAAPRYHQGFLGADFEYHPGTDGYRIAHIVQGDPWQNRSTSPLSQVGINVVEGDILLAINGGRLNRTLLPEQALINQAHTEVQLTVISPENVTEPRTVLVTTLANEMRARYREWVETNRARVHRQTDGRVGYVHVPDMGAYGYAEFHRYYLSESEREGLIVDVRFNGGGNVSQLLLEKLARRRVGYDKPRYGTVTPYPFHSVLGPIVAITNEFAGSDGDIFSHVFKLLNIGPLIGKRTWGGVIGIWPRHSLVDGTTTTQPEFSFWFEDVGWAVENYGTEPDIEVDITPQDYAKNRDPQLDRALAEITRLLAQNPPAIPDFGALPQLPLPRLPKA